MQLHNPCCLGDPGVGRNQSGYIHHASLSLQGREERKMTMQPLPSHGLQSGEESRRLHNPEGKMVTSGANCCFGGFHAWVKSTQQPEHFEYTEGGEWHYLWILVSLWVIISSENWAARFPSIHISSVVPFVSKVLVRFAV